MPVGFEFGVEGQKATRKGGAKVLKSDDIVRSNRELARLFVGMFEGTGLAPLVLFPSASEAAAAKKLWEAPGLEARVQALVPAGSEKQAAAAAAAEDASGDMKVKVVTTTPAAAKAASGGGGGFGGGAAAKGGKGGKKRKKMPASGGGGGPQPLRRVPSDAEVVLAVAPTEPQLQLLKEHCEASGMDKLVIVLNARLDGNGAVGALPPSAESVAFFEDMGDGGFQTSFAFLTQPLGVGSDAPKLEGDPVVLYRAFPDEWVFARKPLVGPPRNLLTRDAADGRPSVGLLREVVEKEGSGGGMLGGLLG